MDGPRGENLRGERIPSSGGTDCLRCLECPHQRRQAEPGDADQPREYHHHGVFVQQEVTRSKN